ncbi:DUF1573 domain-containing protein [Polaribacter batillariae]|uniref:DUF1573 domain-containing protein n=1 Tax=Polaribacter batillariae TaxID=2808900 RepID=A0ABX7SZ42_9FLAO|nr:DUF1573 domain-containing protein [Polaribacter batillariae]
MYNFGLIPAKKDTTAVFNFSNTGETPLVITGVKTSCVPYQNTLKVL